MDNAAAATSSASEVSVSSHLFTVRGYANTKGIGVGRSVESPAFDAAGHRWSVAFYPDGEDQEASGHISVFVRLVGAACGEATVLYGFSLVDLTGAAPAAEASKAPKCVIGTVITTTAPPGSELRHGLDRLLVEDAWSDVVGESSGEVSE
ncbi:unnamed protein product [Urochloa decumbens]|uniref:MATH domain-containing protein n=1 Tax=Urochloa decumbens TaxID=240449 RepID=A0ABC9F8D1_9POAL